MYIYRMKDVEIFQYGSEIATVMEQHNNAMQREGETLAVEDFGRNCYHVFVTLM